jgi:hypothetical protein
MALKENAMTESELADGAAPADLSHAGAVVDKAIEYMVSQNVSSIAIASALLGGALGLLTRTLSDDAVVQILSSAISSVQAGEFHAMGAPQEPVRN